MLSFLNNLPYKTLICSVIGMVSSFLAFLFGGFDNALMIIILFMIIDLFAGSILAFFGRSDKTPGGKLSSAAMTDGLLKKVFVLMSIIVVSVFDFILFNSTEVHIFRDMVIYGFIAAEGISIIEHAIAAGVPIPPILANAFEIMKKKADKDLKDKIDALTETEQKELSEKIENYIENLEMENNENEIEFEGENKDLDNKN